MKNLAIIPARSGSKGLKDKNIKELAGKPLMAYSIEAAIKSGQFDEVMVSTDSEVYKNIAVEYGAAVPFLRSEKNSNDKADSWSVVKEVLDYYKDEEIDFDTICLLQPTSPLRTSEDIKSAYELYKEKNAFAVVSVCEVDYEPFLCGYLDNNKSMENFIERDNNKRRQDMKTSYRINGAIYIVDVDELYKDSFLYREGCYAYIMDRQNSIDIDDAEDFGYAEYRISII